MEREKDGGRFAKFGSASKRNIMVLFLCSLGSLCDGCLFALLSPFYPPLAHKRGVSSTTIGCVFAVYELVFMITSPVLGLHASKIGPKFMYISGLFLAGTSTALFGLLEKCPKGWIFINLSFACRIVQALGSAAHLNVSFLILTAEFTNHVATVIGIIETVQCVGLMFGPALGGALYEAGGFGTPFFTFGALYLLMAVVVIKLLPSTQYANTKEKETDRSVIIRSPVMCISLLNTTSIGVGMTFFSPTFANHILLKFHLSPIIMGAFFAITPGIYAVSSPFWGFVNDKKRIQLPLMIIALLGSCLALLCIGPCPWLTFLTLSVPTTAAGLALFGFCGAIILMSTLKSIFVGALDLGMEDNLETYGLISGLYNSAFFAGTFIGPLIGGILVDHLSFAFGATILSGMYLVMMVVTIGIYLTSRRKSFH